MSVRACSKTTTTTTTTESKSVGACSCARVRSWMRGYINSAARSSSVQRTVGHSVRASIGSEATESVTKTRPVRVRHWVTPRAIDTSSSSSSRETSSRRRWSTTDRATEPERSNCSCKSFVLIGVVVVITVTTDNFTTDRIYSFAEGRGLSWSERRTERIYSSAASSAAAYAMQVRPCDAMLVYIIARV